MQDLKVFFADRTRRLEQYNCFYKASEPLLDRITQLAATVCQTPIALISRLTDNWQRIQSKIGIDTMCIPCEHSFCRYTVLQTDVLEIADALCDERFADSPIVIGEPYVRFYAGCPITDQAGTVVGTISVMDNQPRRLDQRQRQALRLMSEQVSDIIRLYAQKQTCEAFFELVPSMLCITDWQGKFIRVNPAWETNLQYKPEELVGKSAWSVVHPDDVKASINTLESLYDGRVVKGFINRCLSKKGTYHYLEWNARAVGGLVFAACKEITQELHARESLKRSEEHYRLLTEIVSDYVYEVRIADGKIYLEWASENVERILGYSMEELAVPGTWESILWHEDAPKLVCGKKRLAEGEEKINEYRVVTKTGEVRWMRDYNRIIRRDSSTDGYLIGATKDITKEKQAEAALLHTKELLEQTGKAARIGTWELDVLENKLVWSDITRMLHEVPTDFQPEVATAIHFYKEGYSRQTITNAIERAVKEGISFDEELELVTASQRVIWVRAIGIPEWQNGKCVRLYGAFQDIDEQKRIQLALKQSEQALLERNRRLEQLIQLTQRQNERLKEYTYITSHNLRSSVANILSLTDLLLTIPGDIQLLEMLQSAAQQLDNTIHKMNLLLDVDNLAEVSQKEPVPLLDAIRENLELIRNRYAAEAEVFIAVPPQLTVLALPAYVDSILHNLISNALKYRRPCVPCQVEIKARESGEFVVIEVADNGMGIDLAKNGDKLFRIGNRLHTDKEGKGLGLFLTKHQIETMGGRIEVESQPEQGSVFRVYLPKG